MIDESLIIIDSTGSLLSRLNSKEKTTLKEMGYRLDESGIKIEMQQLPDLAIYKSKDDTKIIHHAYYDSEKPHLFSWDDVPGNDSGRLKEFLIQKFGTGLVKTAKIDKIDNGKTIVVSVGKNYISLRLNDEKSEVNLEIDDGRTDELIAKKENSKLNIYKKPGEISKKRYDRCYFLYKVHENNAKSDLSTTLKRFYNKADEDIKEYNKKIIHDIDAVFNFINEPNTELRTDVSSLLEKVKMCLDGNQSIKLAAKSIEIALLFLNRLHYNYNYNFNYNFIIYNSDNPNLKGNINVIIDEKVDGIELSPTKEDIVHMLKEIKDDIRQKDRMSAKKKIESLLNMAGG
ncbi:MAG: hypothetical protein O8C63_12730 [Candidatus Methanoperedens sp.]|nr:hypothetical protein [Candidatus Methanoperedens sp.]